MANKRRANGEGSWWQLPDRTWVHQITIGRKENGSPERKSFKGKTKAICKQRKEEWLAEQEHMKALEEASKREDAQKEEMQKRLGHSMESEAQFKDAFMEWLRLYKSPPTRKPSTYASYLDIYHTHFAPAFDEMLLYQISPDVIQEYYQKKQLNGARMDGRNGGLSPKRFAIIT